MNDVTERFSERCDEGVVPDSRTASGSSVTWSSIVVSR